MKLRIRGNSLRFRLRVSEVAELVEKGVIEDATHFAPGQSLTYGVRLDDRASAVVANYEQSRIEVRIPAEIGRAWAGGSEIGISADQPMDSIDGESKSLRLSIEKDFECQHRKGEGEDQSDAFSRSDFEK